MSCSEEPERKAVTHEGVDGVALLAGEILQGLDVYGPSVAGGPAALSAAWRCDGPAGLERLDGVFACALRDGGRLHLYRDASGLCSLYFRASPRGNACAAPRLYTLRSTLSGGPVIDRRSLHEYLRFLDVSAPNTFLRDVRAVEPGQLLRVDEGEAVPSQPHAPEGRDTVPPNFEAAVDALDERLRSGVARGLAGTQRAAAFLSGGIDSAIVCAVAARLRPGMTALTVGFEGERFDEAPIAARVASHLGIEHRVLRFSRQDYLSAFERLSQRMDQPMADPATMATVLALDHCRERFDVVLDGTGADEAVGAMPPRHVRLAVGYASLLPTGMRRALARVMSSVPGLAGYAPILDFEHPADTMIRWRGFTRPEIEELCGEPVSFEHTQFYRTFARFPRLAHYERYSALLNAMPCERLNQATLVTGMTVRYPFCDRETDRFLRQLPTDWRFLQGQPKRILRALLARYLPREIWDVPKHGFDFPLHNFLAGDDFALVRRYVVGGQWLARGLLNASAVRRYGRQCIDGDRTLMFRVWALVVLGAWLERHVDLT